MNCQLQYPYQLITEYIVLFRSPLFCVVTLIACNMLPAGRLYDRRLLSVTSPSSRSRHHRASIDGSSAPRPGWPCSSSHYVVPSSIIVAQLHGPTAVEESNLIARQDDRRSMSFHRVRWSIFPSSVGTRDWLGGRLTVVSPCPFLVGRCPMTRSSRLAMLSMPCLHHAGRPCQSVGTITAIDWVPSSRHLVGFYLLRMRSRSILHRPLFLHLVDERQHGACSKTL